MKTPLRGEVYIVDLGMAAKVRPWVDLSVPLEELDRSLVTVVRRATTLWKFGSKFQSRPDPRHPEVHA